MRALIPIAHQGKAASEVADNLGLNPKTVREIGRRYLEKGLDQALHDKQRPGAAPLNEPVSGLLYFPMESKQKIKDLELTYAGPGSKLSLRFK